MRRLEEIVKKELHTEIATITDGFGEFLIGKDNKYGDAYGKATACMEVMFPEGVPVDRMGDANYMFHILIKLARVSTDHKEENEDPWKDVAGTAFHAQAKRNIKRRTRGKNKK